MARMKDPAPGEHNDAALVAESLDGDREAFGRLYDGYARLVRAIVYDAFRDYAIAQDLTQEVFLRAYRKLGSLRRPEQFGPWVAGIARQVCRERRRTVRRDRHQFVGTHPALSGSDPPIEEELESVEEQELILGRVAELPERERLAVHSFYLQGHSARRTAALLGVSRSSAYALLQRACRRLAEQLRCRQGKTEGD